MLVRRRRLIPEPAHAATPPAALRSWCSAAAARMRRPPARIEVKDTGLDESILTRLISELEALARRATIREPPRDVSSAFLLLGTLLLSCAACDKKPSRLPRATLSPAAPPYEDVARRHNADVAPPLAALGPPPRSSCNMPTTTARPTASRARVTSCSSALTAVALRIGKLGRNTRLGRL